MKNQLRNNNGGVAPNKIIIYEQFKNSTQECFSKKQRKTNLENVNDSLINLKVRDNTNIIPESTEIINHKNKNVSKNSNTKYKKIKKKTVLVVGVYMVNGIEESKLSKTRHI